jgi:toxin FitB
MYLLDTNVVSEFRRPKPHGAVLAWFASVPQSALYISAVSIGEIQKGIEITREQDEAKALELEAWLATLVQAFDVIAMDSDAFKIWAKLSHRKSKTLSEDLMIAATAKLRNYTIVTRNTTDFSGLNLKVLNPFEFKAPRRG